MRNLKYAKKIVVKIGTSTLTKEDGSLDKNYFETIAKQISFLVKEGRQVIVVSSGAIGSGQHALGIKGEIKGFVLKQACAAMGQNLLMQKWSMVFSKHRLNVAQLLLMYPPFTQKSVRLNLLNLLNTLQKYSAVAIINENDAIAADGAGETFGDNDKLSSLVASSINADLLIVLSDVGGLCTGNPINDASVNLISEVQGITEEIEAIAGKASINGTGGMRTKVDAAKICNGAGITMVICHGREKNVLLRLLTGEEIGTVFLPKENYKRKNLK